MEYITSRQNPLAVQIRKLNTSRSARREAGLFPAEGPKLLAEAVKAGVRMAGGTPIEFPAIAVCDGIAMGHTGMKYSLVTRDLIADST